MIEFQINASKTMLFPQSWPLQVPRLDSRVSKFGTMCLRIEKKYSYMPRGAVEGTRGTAEGSGGAVEGSREAVEGSR